MSRRRLTRREEIWGDLDELYRSRRAARGRVYASVRYCADFFSIWIHRVFAWSWLVDARPARWPIDALHDVRYAWRLYAGRPGPSLVAAVGLGLAIGLGTAIFAIVNAVALRPLGVPRPDTVMRVLQTADHSVSMSWRYGDALELREHSIRVPLEFWMDVSSVELAEHSNQVQPLRVSGRLVGGSYFQVLQGRAAFGRLLSQPDESSSAPPVVVLSHQLWKTQLGADPAVLGRDIWLNGSAFTIVGVTDPSFSDAIERRPVFWVPLHGRAQLLNGSPPLNRASDVNVTLLARVPPAMSPSDAEAAVAAIASAIAVEHDGATAPRGAGARFERLDSRFSGLGASGRVVAITAILSTISLIVLLAYANVTNLLLATASARAHETGVRLALGATRDRLIRQQLTESVLLGAVGGGIGVVVAVSGLPLLLTTVRAPADLDVAFDLRVYVFVAMVTIVAGLAAGLGPASHGTRGNLASLNRTATGVTGRLSPHRLRGALLGVQAAVSMALLIVAALLTRAAIKATAIDLGIPADRLVTVSPALGNHGYNAATAAAFWDGNLSRIRALPGIAAAALVRDPPFGDGVQVAISKRQGRRLTVFFNEVGPGYLETLGLTTLRGRTFSEEDLRTHANVVVLSQSAAREFWTGEDPIGAVFNRIIAGSDPPRIIGIVSDAATERISNTDRANAYALMAPQTLPRASVLVRTTRDPASITRPVQSLLLGADPDLRPSLTLVEDRVEGQLSEPRALATVAGTLGVVALALALVGVYGAATVMVTQRMAEIGVRMAIGATERNVLGMLLWDTLRPVAIGLGAGILAAIGAANVLAGVLFGIRAYDPVALASAVTVLALMAIAAVAVPGRRAARVDPASILRS